MMLRISLRSRELLGARPPIFPLVPVPGSERQTGEQMERSRHGKRTREAQEGQHGLVGPRRRVGCRLEGDSGSPGGGGPGVAKRQNGAQRGA